MEGLKEQKMPILPYIGIFVIDTGTRSIIMIIQTDEWSGKRGSGERIIGRLTMLDKNDKEWIVETIGTLMDRKIDAVEQKFDQKLDKLDKKIDAVEQKFDQKFDKLDKKIDAVEQKLDKKIDAVEQKLDKRIDAVEQKLDKRIDSVEQNLRAEIRGVEDRLTLLIEGKYDHYYKLIAEYVPGAGRTYERLEQNQQRQAQDIRLLQKRSEDNSRRIDSIERIVCR